MDHALAGLALQLEWGADEAVGDLPLDRFAPSPARAPAPSSAASSAPRPASPAQAEPAPTTDAPPLLVRAPDPDALFALWDAADGAGLRATATTTVRWRGPSTAPAMLIADAPAADDDRAGLAFSGPAGALVDRILATAGLGADALLLAHLVPWRPPGGRAPNGREVRASLPYLYGLLALLRPRRLLLVGATTVKTLSSRSETVRKLRGQWLEIHVPNTDLVSRGLPLPPVAQWLDSPRSKEQLWSDLVSFQKAVTTT